MALKLKYKKSDTKISDYIKEYMKKNDIKLEDLPFEFKRFIKKEQK